MNEFRTALDALRNCYMHWTDEASIEESNAREMLLSLCQVIVYRHGNLIVCARERAKKEADNDAHAGKQGFY